MRRKCADVSLLGIAAAITLVSASLLAQVQASAWTTAHLRTETKNEDLIRNYDFESHTDSSTNVDWPVTLLFRDNANVTKVKNGFYTQGFRWEGDPMYAHRDNGGGWGWDPDEGVKNGIVDGPNLHLRIYGAGGSMYNTTWGYYVFATSHKDYYEWAGGWSGYSEDAELALCNIANNIGAWVSHYNNADFHNAEALHTEPGSPADHIWQSSGRRSMIEVP